MRSFYSRWLPRALILAAIGCLLLIVPQAGAQGFTLQIDENGNEFPLPVVQGKASVTLTPTVLWIVARGGEIKTAQEGIPVYAETPGANTLVLDGFEKGKWTYDFYFDCR